MAKAKFDFNKLTKIPWYYPSSMFAPLYRWLREREEKRKKEKIAKEFKVFAKIRTITVTNQEKYKKYLDGEFKVFTGAEEHFYFLQTNALGERKVTITSKNVFDARDHRFYFEYIKPWRMGLISNQEIRKIVQAVTGSQIYK